MKGNNKRDNEQEPCDCLTCKVRDGRELNEEDRNEILTLIGVTQTVTEIIEQRDTEIQMTNAMLAHVLEVTGPVNFTLKTGVEFVAKIKTELSDAEPDGSRRVRLSLDGKQHIKQGGLNVN